MGLIWMLMLKIYLMNCGIADKIFLKDDLKMWFKVPYNDWSTCAGSWIFSKNKFGEYWETCYSSPAYNQNCLLKSSLYNLSMLKDVNNIFVSIELKNYYCNLDLRDCITNMELGVYFGPFVTDFEKISAVNYKTQKVPGVIQKQQNKEEFYLSHDVFSFCNFKNTDFLQVAIIAKNYCAKLVDVKVYYYDCPSTSDVLVTFPKKIAPCENSSPLKIDGECNNGFFENNTESYMECFSNGSYQVYGKCICKEGFEPKGFSCRECSSGYFKEFVGNTLCQKCGLNSISVKTSCICHEGYLRAIGSEKNYAEICYIPLSAPEDIKVSNITSKSVFLKWHPPKGGSTISGYYFIECMSCSIQDKFPRSTNETEIFLNGLDSFTVYILRISYRNFVFNLTNKFSFEIVTFKTCYQVPKPGDKTYIIIAAILVPVLVVVIIAALLVWRKKSISRPAIFNSDFYIYENYKGYDKLLPDEWEIYPEKIMLDKKIGEGVFGNVFIEKISAKFLAKTSYPNKSGFDIHSMVKDSYIDVAVKLLKDRATQSEFDDFVEEINLMKGIGYHKNILSMIGCCTLKKPFCLVVEFMENGDLLNFLRKSCLRTKSTMLHEILLEKSAMITLEDLISFAWQVASGMEFISSIKLVHRDLAARNILVGFDKNVKISDFGLTRKVNDELNYFSKTSRRLPVKWMSVEAIFDHTFTSYSDVWAYGVVLFEIITLGGTPYPVLNNRELLDLLKTGYRMDRPDNCSQPMYDIMLHCWNEDPLQRPTFTELRKLFEETISRGEQCFSLEVDEENNYYKVASFYSISSEESDDDVQNNKQE